MDHVLAYMKANGAPLTREKYLEYAYFGNPPKELSAEEESQLPEQFQNQQPEAGLEALKG